MKLRKIICAVICAATVLSCLAVGTSAADSDFVIEDGVLTRYLGKGGDIVIPEGVVKIGSWVFSEEDVPTTILVPASVKFIDGMAFAGCTTLTDVDVDPKNTAYTSVDGIMYSYDKTVLEQYPVGRKTTKYTVPEHVTTIGNYSMYGNDALAEVVFHDKVTTIQSSAFRSCTQLNNVKLPYGLTFLGDRAFSNCSNLSNISLPDTIKTIDYDAFSYCSSLKSFTVPKSVTHL
ncbi:MAG: leucine-rich repeat domain-containing protein, partial [Clostridia bacterium]|nr:leucine-rich repeat domain-containing protein [Clostridia bacterium]